MTQNKTAIFTSCAVNYIPKARVLASSVKQFHSDVDVYLLLVDRLPTESKPVPAEAGSEARSGGLGRQPQLKETEFDFVVTADSLNIPDYERWIFGHRIVEACTAVKPFMLRHLLAQGYDQVMYFDPDIALFFPLTEMLAEFDDASILLTPHQCVPETDPEAIKDNELCSLKHGVFNFGYVGVANDENGRAYADWWANRCHFACFDDIAGGNFTDQKWNDLTPVFFDRVKILKDPVYNVATWNYSRRNIEGTLEDGFTVDGRPLVFHHFTGYDSGAHHVMLEKYGHAMPATKTLSEWYEARCQFFAQADLAAVKWHYGAYDSGEIIAPHHRKLFRLRKDLQEAFPQPFSTAAQGAYNTSYRDWLKREGKWDAAPETEITLRPFRSFLAATNAEWRGYIERTHRLKYWQKNLLLRMSNGLMRCIAR